MVTIQVTDEGVISGLRSMKGKAFERSKAGLKSGALLITNEAKELVPVLSGNLKRSIHDEPVEVKLNELSSKIGTNVEYGPKIEFGGSRKAAQGYLRPALDEKGDEAINEIKESLMIVFR
ncbi:MAG: HK97 gp10 family phage protein [Ignavibacteriaceae bacterium]